MLSTIYITKKGAPDSNHGAPSILLSGAWHRISLILFAGNDSFVGANLSARAAFDASVGIDVVDIAFRDSLYGANGQTCTASHTFVSDYVSHDNLFFGRLLQYCLFYSAKLAFFRA